MPKTGGTEAPRDENRGPKGRPDLWPFAASDLLLLLLLLNKKIMSGVSLRTNC